MQLNAFLSTLLSTVLLLIFVNGGPFKQDKNGVLVLNATNFQSAIDAYKTMVVLVYLKEDPETNKVIKIIKKVGKLLKDHSKKVVIARLPLDYENIIFNKYNLEGSSGLLALMDHGERFVEYTNPINDEKKILEFCFKKIEEPVTEINDSVKLRSIIENRPCVSVGFFQNFTNLVFDEYRSSADWFYECDHFVTKDVKLFKYFKVEKTIPTIRFYKECIHESYEYPKQLPMDGNSILKFFVVCMEPDVAEYGMNWLTKRVIQQPQFTLLLFIKKDDKNKESYIDLMKKYSRRYREEINMVYFDIDGHEDVASFTFTFDISEKDVPCFRAIETTNRFANNTRKYKPKRKAINDASLRQFIGEVYYRQLQPYLTSEKLPADWNKGPIVTIVGDNFRNITENPSMTVIIAFYTEERNYENVVKGPLTELAKQFENIGRSDILIGKSNYYKNEFYGWHPNRFPNLILFPKGENSYGIEYKMEMTFDDLKVFIESEGKINEQIEKKTKTPEVDKVNNESASIETITNDDEGEVEEITITVDDDNNSTRHVEL